MNTQHPDKSVVLTVAPDQASHGERFVLQSQDGTIYFITPGAKEVDKLTADECARRWNAQTDAIAERPIKIVCDYCFSEDVTFDANACWSVANQRFELSDTHDTAYCNDCGGETTVEEKPL